MSTQDTKAVSIFIVTYMGSEDRGDILRRTCEMALAQNYPDFEVVVSDNAGPYPAAEALKSISDPRLKVVTNTENVGFAGNANRCVELCSNNIIKLLCDDDLLHPDFLSVMVPYVDDETLVVCDVRKFEIGHDPEEMTVPLSEASSIWKRPGGYGGDMWSLSCTPSSIPSATLFTKKLFSELGKYDSKTITADWDFFIENCLYHNLVHVRHTLCFVGVWPGSLTEEMLDRPYFYPMQGLYTKIRVYRLKALPFGKRLIFACSLHYRCLLQTLRLFRHPFSKAYREGYAEYRKRFQSLMRQPVSEFGARPGR